MRKRTPNRKEIELNDFVIGIFSQRQKNAEFDSNETGHIRPRILKVKINFLVVWMGNSELMLQLLNFMSLYLKQNINPVNT